MCWVLSPLACDGHIVGEPLRAFEAGQELLCLEATGEANNTLERSGVVVKERYENFVTLVPRTLLFLWLLHEAPQEV